MMGNYFDGGYGFMGGFGFFFMLLFWGLIVWAIIAGVKMMSGGHNHSCCGDRREREDNAMKTLRERYAKGEITQEKYDQMKKDLST